MKAYRAPTLTELHDLLCTRLIEAPASGLDVISTVDVQIHNVIAQANSMEWDFDLKNMWLTKSRWSMMINQYLDPEELRIWLERCTGMIGTRGRGIATLRTKTVRPRGGAATGHTNKETRRWGSCMLAMTYKAVPRPQITLYSRTSYLGYIGALDLSVAWMAARYLGSAMGMDPAEFRFVWMNEAIQWHNFKSLAFMLNHPDEDRRKFYREVILKPDVKLKPKHVEYIEEHPAVQLSRKWMQNLKKDDAAGKTYGDMNYNTYRRIRRRYHTEVLGFEKAQEFEGWSYYKQGPKQGEQKEFFKAYGELPHVPIQECDFSRFGLLLGGDWATPFDADAAALMEDEDDDE